MSANEIAERFAAAAWVKCGSEGGEGAGAFNPDFLSLRSAVGFKQRIITTTAANTRPLIVLELDRTLSRRETAVLARRIGTVGYNDDPAVRTSYPLLNPLPESVADVFVEPCHLDWFGPDLSAPNWMPFGMSGGGSTLVPPGFNMDRYNALAVLLPSVTNSARVGDFVVAVFEHPPPDTTQQTIIEILPAETPPPPEDPFADVLVRYRADTYTSINVEGGEQVNFFNQMGTGGYGNLSANGSMSGLPFEDSAFNEQPIYQSEIPMEVTIGTGSNPDAWDFLLSGESSLYMAYTFNNTGPTVALDFVDSQLELTISPDDPNSVELDAGSIISNVGLPDLTSANQGVALVFKWIGSPASFLMGNTVCGDNGGQAYDSPPPEAATAVLRLPNGNIVFAEIMMWDRPLTPGEQTIVETYFTTRYGIVPP